MAQVDFSNAVLEPYHPNNYSPTGLMDLSQGTSGWRDYCIVNSSGSRITQSGADNVNVVIGNDDRELLVRYWGTFNTSGTELYINCTRNGTDFGQYWKISNISFSPGDTYDFTIDCTLLNSFAS